MITWIISLDLFPEWKSSLHMEFTNWKQAADSVAAVGDEPPNLSIQIESQTSPVHWGSHASFNCWASFQG